LFAQRQKVTKKRFFFSQWALSADSTSVLLAADARIPARDHRRRRLRATGIKLLETLDGTKPRAVRFKSKISFSLLLLPTHRESTACGDVLQEARYRSLPSLERR
ncbi:MAG TPA: hypothetical protein VH082_00150, partial [Rudaea sp.]|nr:hypothetical protein [Rudaea sp.]